MIKNDICLGHTSKQNALFSKIMHIAKNTPMPPMSTVGLIIIGIIITG